jgi:hypothetical protein
MIPIPRFSATVGVWLDSLVSWFRGFRIMLRSAATGARPSSLRMATTKSISIFWTRQVAPVSRGILS